MRRILIERARAKKAVKRGGDIKHLTLDAASIMLDDVPVEILDLDDALTRFAEIEPEKAQLVMLRFFCGLTMKQASALMGLPPTTADRHWAFARAWLYDDLVGSSGEEK